MDELPNLVVTMIAEICGLVKRCDSPNFQPQMTFRKLLKLPVECLVHLYLLLIGVF
jgi:hypothetical protein